MLYILTDTNTRRDSAVRSNQARREQRREARRVPRKLVTETLAELMPALLRGVQFWCTPREVTQFERRVFGELFDFVRRKIWRVVQHYAEFFAEFGLECIQQPYREIACEIILAWKIERLAVVSDSTQQFQTLPRARHRQCRALSFGKPRIDEIRQFLPSLVDRYDRVLVVQIGELFLNPSRNAS